MSEIMIIAAIIVVVLIGIGVTVNSTIYPSCSDYSDDYDCNNYDDYYDDKSFVDLDERKANELYRAAAKSYKLNLLEMDAFKNMADVAKQYSTFSDSFSVNEEPYKHP